MKSKSVCPSVASEELNVKGPTFNYASIAGIASGGNGSGRGGRKRALPHGQVAGCGEDKLGCFSLQKNAFDIRRVSEWDDRTVSEC